MRTASLISSALLGALALAAVSPAPAHAGDANELSIGSFNRALRSSSANAVTGENLGGGALGVARDLHLHPIPGLALWAVAGFAWGGAEGQMFQTLATEIDTLSITAGARARYALARRVVASARLDVGTARTALRLEDAMGRTAGDARWGGTGTGALGLDLFAVAGPRIWLGLRFELGYVVTTAPALTATSDRGGDGELRLPMTEASLGSLDLGGRFFALSVLSQF